MTKDQLRARARDRMRAVSPDDRARAARAIVERVLELPEIESADVLLLYASLPSEVATDAIAAAARARGAIVTYPRCLSETREMVIHRVDDARGLTDAGTYGIREPALECPIVGLEEIDVALVPGLAWDRSGARLGRGAGYYDRLFGRHAWRGSRIGLFFAVQEVHSIPVEPWDAPLHAIVTEDETWRVG